MVGTATAAAAPAVRKCRRLCLIEEFVMGLLPGSEAESTPPWQSLAFQILLGNPKARHSARSWRARGPTITPTQRVGLVPLKSYSLAPPQNHSCFQGVSLYSTTVQGPDGDVDSSSAPSNSRRSVVVSVARMERFSALKYRSKSMDETGIERTVEEAGSPVSH